MTKLAIYDKKYGDKDRKIAEKFKWDYVYFRNFWMRLGVLCSFLIIALFYGLNKLIVEKSNILSIDYKQEVINLFIWLAVALVAYTLVYSYSSAKEYRKSQERTQKYFDLLDKLDTFSERDNNALSESANVHRNTANPNNAKVSARTTEKRVAGGEHTEKIASASKQSARINESRYASERDSVYRDSVYRDSPYRDPVYRDSAHRDSVRGRNTAGIEPHRTVDKTIYVKSRLNKNNFD